MENLLSTGDYVDIIAGIMHVKCKVTGITGSCYSGFIIQLKQELPNGVLRECNPLENVVLRQPDVSGSFMCAHGAENKCNEQCFTCSEDERCDARYSYKATMIHYFQFTEWIAERYNYIGGEWCCWCAKQYDIKDTERYKNTSELWAYWWENCR